MDTPRTRFLPCNHDPASVVVIPTEDGYRFRCPVCGAESFEREAPEWFREAWQIEVMKMRLLGEDLAACVLRNDRPG